ncbi:Down syndrome cell adhesion molecule-like protein 1, partial [Chamberlinius hualienensis]
PPSIKEGTKWLNVSVNGAIQIKCETFGDKPINVSWWKEEKLITTSTRFQIKETTTESGVLSLLNITTAIRDDNGNFSCVAENNFGKNTYTYEVIVKEKPDSPADLRVDATGSRYVELSWKKSYSGKDSVKKYIIQYKEAQNSWNDAITMETVNGEPTNSIVSHLQPATHYVFRLFAENSVGRSDSSPILRVTTNEDVPSGPPLHVQVESVNTETFKVMWKPPEEKFWNGKLQGYNVGYKEVDTEYPYLFKTLLTPEPHIVDNFVQISGLKQFTKYAVVVQAYNAQGTGPQSEPVVVMTSEGAPSLPPVDLRCTTLTSQSIHVTWTAPSMDSINGILRGYKVVYKPASDWFDDLAESFNITLPTSMTLSRLEKFSNYSIQVLAMTKAGDGPRSNAVFCKTQDDVPGSPTDIKAVATSDDSVIVAWKSPDHPNGIIRSYTIYWKSAENAKEAGSHTVPVRDQSYEVTKLKKGNKYEFWATASTMAGEGSPSRSVVQIPNGPTVPAKVVSFEDKIISPWKSDTDLPCHSVGIPEPTKKWLLKGKMIDPFSQDKITADGSLSLKNLQEEDAGDYTCVVKNDYGEDKITYTIIVLAPPSAPVVEIITISSNVIEVQWKTPLSKMSRIKGYALNMRRDGTDWKEINLGADVRSYRLNNLDCGTRYEIYMTAFNKIGMGEQSEILSVATNGSVPASPMKSDLVEESSTSVSLYLNTWKSNGCPIHYFTVEYSLKSSVDWVSVANNVKPEQRRLVIPNLKPGTWYNLRMNAHNSAGTSIAKYEFATLTLTGATVLPDLMADSSNEQLDGIWAYLNFYILVPIGCTILILFFILGVACFYVRTRNGTSSNKGTRVSNSEMKKGDSSESFSYLQRSSLNKKHRHLKRDSANLAPYATLQLANQRPSTSHASSSRDSSAPPPLPPPRNEAYNSGAHHRHHRRPVSQNPPPFFQLPPPPHMPLPPVPPEFMAHPGASETTFMFPNMHGDGGMSSFPPQYPHEAMKPCFK